MADASERSDASEGDSALRRRTRQAIVDAAVRVWARDFRAPLSAVAEQAGVSRSTLHRYYADKDALVEACLLAAEGAFEAVPSPLAGAVGALDQLVAEIEHVLPLGHWVLFLWGDPSRFAGRSTGWELFGEEASEPLREILRAGQAEGELDATVPVEWLLSVFYSLLYGAVEMVVAGSLTTAEASRLAGRALRHGIGPVPGHR